MIVPEAGYEFEVGEGVTLTLGPGLVVKPSGGTVHVTGELIAEGTASESIAITSIKDDAVGGDTNMDGSASSPAPGDWGSIRFSNAVGVDLSYLDLRYAKTAIDIPYLDSMTISNSDFVYDEAAIDVGATAKNDPALGALTCVPPTSRSSLPSVTGSAQAAIRLRASTSTTSSER